MSHLVHVEVHQDSGCTVVAVHGRIFADTVASLRTALAPLLDTDPPRIVLDMSGVEICDSSGLNLIASSHDTATRRGGWLRLVGLQPMVRRVIMITNLDQLLSVHATVDEATYDRSP
jgi:anti-sigma B factor antagonist